MQPCCWCSGWSMQFLLQLTLSPFVEILLYWHLMKEGPEMWTCWIKLRLTWTPVEVHITWALVPIIVKFNVCSSQFRAWSVHVISWLHLKDNMRRWAWIGYILLQSMTSVVSRFSSTKYLTCMHSASSSWSYMHLLSKPTACKYQPEGASWKIDTLELWMEQMAHR